MRSILIIFCIGFLIIAYPLFSDGMFMDGLIYAAVSDNLANGHGSMFHLSFSKTLFSNFHEHPPLAIWLESVFHYLFNGSTLSERFYSLFMWLINGGLIVWLWKELKQPFRLAWVPLFLWAVLPEVGWSFANNLLENTMGVFVTLSIIMYIKSLDGRRGLYVGLYALSIVLILMSKGFTGAYVLAFPGLIGLFWKKEFLVRSIIDTIVTVVLVFSILSIIYFSSTDAAFYFSQYLIHQVKGSVENVQVVSFRGQIVLEYFNSLIIPIVIVLISYLYSRKKGLKLQHRNGLIIVLILTSLCGVLPIMVSLKQRPFYIITVFPLVTIGLSMYIIPVLKLIDDWMAKHVFKKSVSAVLVLLSIGVAIISSTLVGREATTLQDSYAMHRILPEGTIIDVSASSRFNWVLIGHLSRNAKISINQTEVRTNYYLRRLTEPDIDSYKEYPMQEFVLEVINPGTNPK